MKKIVLTFLMISLKSFAFTQSFFSVVPDFGGDEMEGRLYNVIPLQNEIKLIGLVHDSIVPGFEGGTWPILGTMSYDGDYLGTSLMVDSLYSDGFYYFTRRLVFKNDSICYIYDRRDLGNFFLDAYLVELNLISGKIIRSKTIFDTITTNEDFVAEDITLDKFGNIYLINVTNESGPHPQILTVLDSNFNLLKQKLIPDNGRGDFTKFTEIDDEGNIILIGVSVGAPSSIWFDSKLFRQVLDKDLNQIDYRLAATNIDHSIITTDSYTIIKSSNGDWICATQFVSPTSDCQDCSIWIPYVVCISDEFKEVRWETRMFDGNINLSEPFYYSNSITEVSDGYIFAGSTDGAFGIETSGLLGKVGFNGDSLWLKHYIPVGWDTVQGRWFFFQDIKTTPIGNIIVGGEGSDRYTSSIRPWILQLDKDGCLEPGCNTSSISNDLDGLAIDLRIFPNPAVNNCSIQIHNQNNSSTDLELRIVNNEGKEIYKTHVLNGDFQYLIDLKEWQPGAYYVQLMDKAGAQLSRKLIVLK